MKTMFTPGPWATEHLYTSIMEGNSKTAITAAPRNDRHTTTKIAEAIYAPKHPDYFPSTLGEAEANAHLIAAAPTGFAAAEAAYIALLQVPDSICSFRVKNQSVLAALRDYIALATNQDAQAVQEHYEDLARSQA